MVIYDEECPYCHQTLQKLVRMDREGLFANRPWRLVIVEMPPYAAASGREPLPLPDSAITARLSDHREWFVETPVVLSIDAGIVTEAAVGSRGVGLIERRLELQPPAQ